MVYMLLEVLFWLALFLILYPYIGYPILLKFFLLFYRYPVLREPVEPAVTLMITAYNEAEFIEAKLLNSLALDYSPEKLQIIVTSDGSTDGTNEKLLAFEDSRLDINILPERRGKMAAILAGMALVRGDILIFSDATAIYDKGVIRAFVRNFADPSVGGVSGSLIMTGGGDPSIRAGEGIYWRLETFLRRMESETGSTIIAPGSIYAIKTELFEAPPRDTVADDFAITLSILERGYRMVLEEDAAATERISVTLSDEFARKCRIVAGGIQTLLRYRHLLKPSQGLLAFKLASHKLLRWLVPYGMIAAYILNIWLLESGLLYRAAFMFQCLFYGLALSGLVMERQPRRFKIPSIAFHFCAINVAAMVGWYRQFTHTQPVKWAKTAK